MVETIRLESGHTLTGIVGSNPTLSAILIAADFRAAAGQIQGAGVFFAAPHRIHQGTLFTREASTALGVR